MSTPGTKPATDVDRDVDEWVCRDCMRILEDGPYDVCPDCESDDVQARRKFVVVTTATIEVPAEELNLTFAANQARGNDDRIVAIYDKDTGEQIYDVETDPTEPFYHPLDDNEPTERGADGGRGSQSGSSGLLGRAVTLGKALLSG